MLTKEQLKHLAELAKIEFSDEELEKFLVDFNNILNYVEEIRKLDLNKFKPMIGGPIQKLELREDVVIPCPEETKKEIINQYPQRQNNYLKISKIITKS